MDNQRPAYSVFLTYLMAFFVVPFVLSCAQVDVPGARTLRVDSPTAADERREAVNEKPDSVLYLPLGSDVLVPKSVAGRGLPTEEVGPFELRSETLAGALQLILSDYELPLAFETDEALTRTITVSNLKGPLDRIVERVCGLADLYCLFEDGILVVKETQTFAVSVPPVGGETDFLGSLATGLGAIIGGTPITESATRTIIYEATSRTAELAERYFQRLRANTALIVFEVYIWEVALTSDNSSGINWEQIEEFGKFSAGISLPSSTIDSPISIGLPTTGNDVFGANDVLQFISNYGAVKTISQPQITVLSGSEATLRAAETQNFVSSITRTIDNGEVAVSTETDSVDSGFTMTISGNWDNSTIYGNVEIDLQQLLNIDEFSSGSDDSAVTVQVPRTTERELSTQIRIRPGDSLLIAGLVQESDNFNKSGPGFDEPLFPTSRSVEISNTEVVFLLRPRVIVYTDERPDLNQGVPAGEQSKTVKPARANQEREPLKFFYDSDFPKGSITKESLNPAL